MSHECFENEINSCSGDGTQGCGELLMIKVENVEHLPVRHLVSFRFAKIKTTGSESCRAGFCRCLGRSSALVTSRLCRPMLFRNQSRSNQFRSAGILIRGIGTVPRSCAYCVALGPSTNGYNPLVIAPFKRDSQCVVTMCSPYTETRFEANGRFQ